MQPHFRFPRSTVSLMLVILAGVVFAIAEASSVAGDTLGSAGVLWYPFWSLCLRPRRFEALVGSYPSDGL
jgi:hypothetical protein